MGKSLHNRQNCILKFIAVIFTAVSIALLPADILPWFAVGNVAFCFSGKVLHAWWRAWLRLATFPITYVLAALLFGIDFPGQILFIARYTLLLYLSVYLIVTTPGFRVASDLSVLFGSGSVVVTFVMGLGISLAALKTRFSALIESMRPRTPTAGVELLTRVFVEGVGEVDSRDIMSQTIDVPFLSIADLQSVAWITTNVLIIAFRSHLPTF